MRRARLSFTIFYESERMYRPRIIPVLLIKNGHLVKTTKFNNYNYIGDPINAVRLFNELEADELIILDIDASTKGKCISNLLVKEIGEEANMPFVVGGGIRSCSDIQSLLRSGAEKVILGNSAAEKPTFIKEASEEFGSSTISVCIDVYKPRWRRQQVYRLNGRIRCTLDPLSYAKIIQDHGAGELVVQSINRDGSMSGYDLKLIAEIAKSVSIPVVALGGAGSGNDLKELREQTGVNGMAAGSLFVYFGTQKGVLINYISAKDLGIHNEQRV